MGSGPPGELHRYQLGKGAGTASSRSGVKKLSPASLSVFFSIFAVFVVFFSVPGSTPSLGVRRLLVCRPPPRRAPLLGGVPLLPRRGPDPRPLQPAPRPPRRPARRMPRPPPTFPLAQPPCSLPCLSSENVPTPTPAASLACLGPVSRGYALHSFWGAKGAQGVQS